MRVAGRRLPQKRGHVVVIRASPPALEVDEPRVAAPVEHNVARLEVAVHETVGALCREVFGKEPEVGLELQLVEIELGGLEEAILEIVEVEQNAVHVELGLRVAVAEVEPAGAPYLYVGQLPDGAHEQLFLVDIVAPSGLPATGNGVEERHRAEVGLQVAQLVVAHGEHTRHGQAPLVEVIAEVNERMVFVAARAHHADHGGPVGIGHAVILAVAACLGQLLHVGRGLSGPLPV